MRRANLEARGEMDPAERESLEELTVVKSKGEVWREGRADEKTRQASDKDIV